MLRSRLWVALTLLAVGLLLAGRAASDTRAAVECGSGPTYCVKLQGLEKSSRYRVTNQGSAVANAFHTFYTSPGDMNIYVFAPPPIPVGGSQTHDLSTIGAIPTGYTGYVLIQADQPITGTLLVDATPTATPSLTPSATATAGPSVTASTTSTPGPSPTATATARPSPTASPIATQTPRAVRLPLVSKGATPTAVRSAIP